MMALRYDLAVVGAGIMGLASALRESRRGRKVAILSPAVSGGVGPAATTGYASVGGATSVAGAASWAAAGILVTRDARVFHSAYREFYVRSIHAYPEWLRELAALSGKSVPLHRHGDYLVFDLDSPGAEDQLEAKRRQWDREHARNFTESDALPAFLAHHSPLRKVRVFHFPEEAYVQNRDLLDSLHEACRRQGVDFVDGAPMAPWSHHGGMTELKAGRESIMAAQVLVAAGAWTAPLLDSLGFAAPLIPVKGQMMRIPKFHDRESMVHFGEELYLVPRGDTLVVGATTEAGTWEDAFDQEGEAYLNRHLKRFLPGIAAGPVERWAGLRPRTKDRLPWMGWLDASKGWAVCAGHYKCGISMAPLAADCMSSLMNGEKPPVDLASFDPLRKKGLVRRD